MTGEQALCLQFRVLRDRTCSSSFTETWNRLRRSVAIRTGGLLFLTLNPKPQTLHLRCGLNLARVGGGGGPHCKAAPFVFRVPQKGPYLKVHGTCEPITTALITLLIMPLQGLIGVIPNISRVLSAVIIG